MKFWPIAAAPGGRTACFTRLRASQIVKIDGSSTVFPVTEAVAEEFQKAKKQQVKVTVGISGTGGGFKKFCRGETDISNASRPILKAGDGRLQEGRHRVHRAAGRVRRADGGRQPEEHAWSSSITVAELKKMWEPAAQGKVTNWNQVNPAWPDQPLKLFGAGRRLRHVRLLHRGDRRQGQVQPRRLHRVRRRQRAGAGRVARRERARLLRLRVLRREQGQAEGGADRRRQDGKPAVAPSMEAVLNGTYQPLSRPIFIYVNAKSLGKPEVKEFVEFYMKNGAKLAKEVKYVPLPRRRLQDGARARAEGQDGHRVRRRGRSRRHDRRAAEARSQAVDRCSEAAGEPAADCHPRRVRCFG